LYSIFFFFSSRRRHTRFSRDWSSDVCSSDLTLFNSLLITIVSVVLIIVFSAMAAYALSRAKSKLSTVLFFVFVAAMLIPFQSVMIPLVTVFGQFEMLSICGLIFMYLGFAASISIILY